MRRTRSRRGSVLDFELLTFHQLMFTWPAKYAIYTMGEPFAAAIRARPLRPPKMLAAEYIDEADPTEPLVEIIADNWLVRMSNFRCLDGGGMEIATLTPSFGAGIFDCWEIRSDSMGFTGRLREDGGVKGFIAQQHPALRSPTYSLHDYNEDVVAHFRRRHLISGRNRIGVSQEGAFPDPERFVKLLVACGLLLLEFQHPTGMVFGGDG